ncbi:MAG: hypothetical protein IK058_05030 [Bacteroidales bacterium]|nr:hypothetical protein [Bacteroidales bacterium]
MKKRIILCLAALALLAVGCSKQKTCRCSVLGLSTVRIITINHGECNQLHTYNYHTDLDTLVVDSLVCTDYEFEIDTLFND